MGDGKRPHTWADLHVPGIVPVANSNLIHNLHSKTPWYLAPGKQNKVTPLNPLPRIILTDPSSAIEYAVIGQRLHSKKGNCLRVCQDSNLESSDP